MMSRSRRPSVSIYDYPEHLNPFNENSVTSSRRDRSRDDSSKSTAKEPKHKFWTFGRSRRKRSHSFSIKSTWNGLFGKRKESTDSLEKGSTITTVSSTYKREPFDRPTVPSRTSRDQQEFDEALGTLARRRKYTLDNSSRCSSSLTVNGDPTRIYDGSPKDTTTSILGDLTPKPPARRFGQVSPRPTDKIPPLNYEDKQSKYNGSIILRDTSTERTPVPPLRRFAARSSQMSSTGTVEVVEDERKSSTDVTLRDENENVPEDYIFKRFSQDAVRRSNISINSCISISSTTSGYTRKKRRAPQPPLQTTQQLGISHEKSAVEDTSDTSKLNLDMITEPPIDINRVTENIDELTKKSHELLDTSHASLKQNSESFCENETDVEGTKDKLRAEEEEEEEEEEETEQKTECHAIQAEERAEKKNESESIEERFEEDVDIEYVKMQNEKVEIFKEIDQTTISTMEPNEVCLRRRSSSDTLSRSDSFSVKDEIEKIERQIKALECKNTSTDSTDNSNTDDCPSNTRLSIQANRRYFFQNMVDPSEKKEGVKIEIKELPREQKDIHLVRLCDPPVHVKAPREAVKVIELHISEPIRQKAELLDDVNPIPKPRRHASLTLNSTEEQHSPVRKNDQKRLEPFDGRGKSV